MTEPAPYLTLHVPPDEMVKYIQDLMTLPHGEIAASSAMTLAQRHWGGDTPLARAALLRWGALNLAFQDKRLETWTVTRERDRIQVPAALVAAAGVALAMGCGGRPSGEWATRHVTGDRIFEECC